MTQRISAGELSQKAYNDTTTYDALEVGHAVADDIGKHLRESIEIHKKIIDENEFCVVMIIAKDPLINHGCNRIYDLFDCDFTKIKGLGVSRIRDLTACLDKFFSML